MGSKLSPLAQADLDETWCYLALESGNEATADRWSDLLVDKARMVGVNPGLGRARSCLAEGLRSVSFRNYLIVYVKRKSLVEVVCVLHGSRDLSEMSW
jgi:plasmid stabilization system protein ParE